MLSIFGIGLTAMHLFGIGGTGAIGIGARILGYDRKLVTAAKRIPLKTWLYIITGAIAAGALLWHVIHEHRAVKKAVAAAYAQGRDDYAAKVEQQARSIEARAKSVTDAINQQIRDHHNEELGRIHFAADALRVRGPGAAVCRDPALAGAAGGREQAGGPGDASVARLPYPQWSALIGVPFDDATRFADQHDAYRDEVKSWQEWYPRMAKAWDQLRASVSGKQSKP